MSDPIKVRAEVQRWLTYAVRDLDAAKTLADTPGGFHQQVCFLSQQAAEKGLKAALIYIQVEFPFRHDLELLRTLFPQDWECSQLTNLATLSEWAVESRYPTNLAEPSAEDATLAVNQAELILSLVQQDLIQYGFDRSYL